MEMYSARSVASLTIGSVQLGSPLCFASSSESFQCGRLGEIHFAGSVGIGAHASMSRCPWASMPLRETERPATPSAANTTHVIRRGTLIALLLSERYLRYRIAADSTSM